MHFLDAAESLGFWCHTQGKLVSDEKSVPANEFSIPNGLVRIMIYFIFLAAVCIYDRNGNVTLGGIKRDKMSY